MLRSAQAVRLVGAEQPRPAPVGEGQQTLAWLELRIKIRRRDRQNAALAFDEDVAGVCFGRRDQRPARFRHRLRLRDRPLGDRQGFAPSAPRHNQENAPVPRRRKLLRSRPQLPVRQYLGGFIVRQAAQEFLPCLRRQHSAPGFRRVFRGHGWSFLSLYVSGLSRQAQLPATESVPVNSPVLLSPA